MTTPAVTIKPQATVAWAAELMTDLAINRLPVVDDDKLVGIIARADLVRALVHAARKVANSTAHTTSRLTELERQAWTRQNTLR